MKIITNMDFLIALQKLAKTKKWYVRMSFLTDRTVCTIASHDCTDLELGTQLMRSNFRLMHHDYRVGTFNQDRIYHTYIGEQLSLPFLPTEDQVLADIPEATYELEEGMICIAFHHI